MAFGSYQRPNGKQDSHGKHGKGTHQQKHHFKAERFHKNPSQDPRDSRAKAESGAVDTPVKRLLPLVDMTSKDSGPGGNYARHGNRVDKFHRVQLPSRIDKKIAQRD